MIQDVTIPDIGEKIESLMVVDILVSKGDIVEIDQGLIEVETNKAVVEIPSPVKGKVTEITVNTENEVKIGQVIARIEILDESAQPEPEKTEPPTQIQSEPESKQPSSPTPPAPQPAAKQPEPSAPASKSEEEKAEAPPLTASAAPAAPSVRRLARELGVDINGIPGSGPGERITSEDVREYVKQVMTSGTTFALPDQPAISMPDFSRWGEIRKEKISSLRNIIGQSMSRAWNIVPHVTQFDEADITELESFRKQYAKQIEKNGGKLTITAILLKILAAALKKYPKFNASIDPVNDEIIYKKYINIAIAVDTDRGLLVPVLRDVDKKSIRDISVELIEITEKTRNKKIMPDDLEGGTFTISNQGGIGGTNFTPIVYWPQVAILGVSRSQERLVLQDGKPVSKTILPLSLSYDHRIIDGADAARFLKWVADALVHPLLINLES